VPRLFLAYRVLAFIVGTCLAFGAFVALPLRHLAAQGSSLQQFGEHASVVWVVHGFVFIVYVLVAFVLSRRAGWTWAFTILALIAGLIPLLIFFVEHRVVLKMRAEHPELAKA
jgi:integral membrane protein